MPTVRPRCPGCPRSGGGSRCGRSPATSFVVLLIPVLFTVPALVARVRAAGPARPGRGTAARPARSRVGCSRAAEPDRARVAPAVPTARRLARRLRDPERDRRQHHQRPRRHDGHPPGAGDDHGPRRHRRADGRLHRARVQHPGLHHRGLRHRRRASARDRGGGRPRRARPGDERVADAVPAEPSDGGHRGHDAAHPDPGRGLRARERRPVRRDRSHRAPRSGPAWPTCRPSGW